MQENNQAQKLSAFRLAQSFESGYLGFKKFGLPETKPELTLSDT
jgi:hypothetical protein